MVAEYGAQELAPVLLEQAADERQRLAVPRHLDPGGDRGRRIARRQERRRESRRPGRHAGREAGGPGDRRIGELIM